MAALWALTAPPAVSSAAPLFLSSSRPRLSLPSLPCPVDSSSLAGCELYCNLPPPSHGLQPPAGIPAMPASPAPCHQQPFVLGLSSPATSMVLLKHGFCQSRETWTTGSAWIVVVLCHLRSFILYSQVISFHLVDMHQSAPKRCRCILSKYVVTDT